MSGAKNVQLANTFSRRAFATDTRATINQLAQRYRLLNRGKPIVCFRSKADLWEPGSKSQPRGLGAHRTSVSQPSPKQGSNPAEGEDEDDEEEPEEEEREEAEEEESEESEKEEAEESEEEEGESEQEDAEGEEQLEANCTEIKWQTIGHHWLMQKAVCEFEQSGQLVGTVTKWVPADPQDESNIALFHVVHADGSCNCAYFWQVCGVNGAWVS